MRLTSIEIENMFSYCGKYKINFDKTTCIIGANGLGKTSILNAIKLCLGHINFSLESIINNNTQNNQCSIKLTFDEFVISKLWHCGEKVEESIFVQIDSEHQLDGAEAEHFIHNKFPDFLIDFIFYDGEIGHNLFLLSPVKLKNLFDYVFDLDILVNIQKDSANAAKSILEKNNDKESAELLKLENEHNKTAENLASNKTTLDSLIRESKRLDLEIQKTETQIRNKNKNLNKLKIGQEQLKGEHTELLLAFKETIMYQMPLLLNKNLLEKLSKKTHSPLLMRDEKLFSEKFRLLKDELGIGKDYEEAMSIFKSIMLSDVMPTNSKMTVNEYKDLLEQLKMSQYELKKIAQEIKTIENSSSNSEVLKTLFAQRDRFQEDNNKIRLEINDMESKITEAEGKLLELKKLLTQSFKTNQEKYANIKSYEELIAISNASRKIYGSEIVEKLEIFNTHLKKNIKEFISQYKHITDIYLDTDLKIIVKDMQKNLNIELLSAGQKQVLNFLLVKTILDFRNISSFLMVDTPFGRLSNHNKNLLLNSCYLKFENLALLVTDSEYEYVQSQNMRHNTYMILKGNLGSEIKAAS